MIRGIIFDFDLTLVDSSKGIWENLNALADEKGLRRLSYDEVRPTIGWALADAMKTFWGDGPINEEWLPRYRALFSERNYAGVAPFPQTVPALEYLRDRSIALAIATNRFTHLEIVKASGLDAYFPIVLGLDKHKPKPDPDMLLDALRLMKLSREEALYVGDSEIDMRTAQNAGVCGVGVTTGNHDSSALTKSGATRVIKDLSELPSLLSL